MMSIVWFLAGVVAVALLGPPTEGRVDVAMLYAALLVSCVLVGIGIDISQAIKKRG